MSKPREQMTPAEVAGAQAASMERFYSEVRPDLRCTANTHLIREWSAKNMPPPVLVTIGDIEWAVSQIGEENLAVRRDKPAQEFVPPVPGPSYAEKLSDYQEKWRNANPLTLRKISLVQSLRGYTPQQRADVLRDRGFSPLTESESELLTPPQQTEGDVRAVRQNAEDEVAAASARIGQLLGRGPVSRLELMQMSNDALRKLLWPHPGMPKNVENERLIDLILNGGLR